MQLGLFDDNLPTVLLNIAEEFIRARDLPRALSVYEQLLSDSPGDDQVAALRQLVEAWRDPLSEIGRGAGLQEGRPCFRFLPPLASFTSD